MSLEIAHKVIVPPKKILSRSFLNSGTLIVIIGFFTNAEQAQNKFMLMLENTPIDINARRIFDQKQNDFNCVFCIGLNEQKTSHATVPLRTYYLMYMRAVRLGFVKRSF